MVGKRASARSLWMVPLGSSHTTADNSDGIPPPHTRAALHATLDGVYIEANHVSQHDNASYVRFIHACLGYPAPTTFLRAVTAGFITGPHQFPRLTAKMVQFANIYPTPRLLQRATWIRHLRLSLTRILMR